MNDREFLGYVEFHCRTERALFSGIHIVRLYELANKKHQCPVTKEEWYGMHDDIAGPLVISARALMAKEIKLKNLLK